MISFDICKQMIFLFLINNIFFELRTFILSKYYNNNTRLLFLSTYNHC